MTNSGKTVRRFLNIYAVDNKQTKMGNILITQEGVETSTIEEKSRDESLRNFYEMIDKAKLSGDSCFMTEEAYCHTYSYGNPYPAFINLSWDEFRQIESLKGISQTTYDYITNNFWQIYPEQVANEKEFEEQNLPKGKGGFEHSDSLGDFLCNSPRWEEWHRDHLTNHPEDIKWEKSSPFIPNVKAVSEILQEEIWDYIRREYKEHINEADKERIWSKLLADDKVYHENEDATQPIKQNATVLFFHRVVLTSMDHEAMTAYCKKIGKKVCLANYYYHEKELSSREQRACGSLRQIYSIVKNGEKQYISLDFHKGMFEFHDSTGRHLGEFLFDGSWNKRAEEDHDLRTL